MTRSRSSLITEIIDDFEDQCLLEYGNAEQCQFTDDDINLLRSNGRFPEGTRFRVFDPRMKADLSSPTWVCFHAFPFTLGLSYPFPSLISDFFKITGLAYAQAMPQIWRILHTLDKLNDKHSLTIGLPEIASNYQLRTHGGSRFVLQLRTKKSPFVYRATQDNRNFLSNFFFVERSSIPGGEELPEKWIKKGRI